MRPPVIPFARWAKLFAALAGWLAVTSLALAQGTGTVQGRVFNPRTNQYVRNAEVRLEGTNQVVFTENDGSFQFTNVPVGQATVTVAFTGYQTAKDTFSVTAGQAAVRDINLISTEGSGDVVQLQAFTVASEREGNSKAIMTQRREMNIVTSVSSDIFGDVTDGNVGEFLKYLPGVDLDYVESEPRGPRLGGMDGQYVGVAFDGMRTASADANRGGGSASRATSFEGFSITSIDSIEINRTASPENDADSPAGTVNMRTKRAFDRKGRTFGYNVSYNFNSEEFTLKATDGPRDKKDKKAKPNWQFDYAESFFNQRFGVLVSASRSHSYTEQQIGSDIGYNNLAGDARPMVIRSLNFSDGPKFIRKDSLLLTTDWKATQHLTLSLNLVYSYFEGEFWNRSFTWVAANDNNNVRNGRSAVGGDGMTTIIANRDANNDQARLDIGGGGSSKLTYTRQFAPRFEYKQGAWVIDGALALSRSKNNYEAIERGFGGQTETGSIGSSFIATRPHARSWEWTIRQTGGPAWDDVRNFTSTDSRAGGTRISNRAELWITEKWTGTLNARWIVPFMERFRTTLKTGAKWDEETRNNNNYGDWSIWSYIGPGGNTVVPSTTGTTTTIPGVPTGTYQISSWGSWGNLGANYISSNTFEFGRSNALTVQNAAGQNIQLQRPSRNAPAELFVQHPELFVNTATVENYYTSFIANRRNFRQTLTSGYIQADTRLTSKLQLRTGVRAEETQNDLTQYNPRTRAEVIAAGYPANAVGTNSGRAATLPGLFYQFTSQPRVTRSSKYRSYFPSVLLKYNLLPNLEWQAGFNKGISRPPIDNLTGLWVIDESALRVNAPNPNLQPEKHKVIQSRVAYYFGGKSPGQLSLAFLQDKATNFITTQDYTSTEFGNTDPDLETYTFRSTRNNSDVQRYRNFDFNYNQTLGFLGHEMLRGLNVGLTYSRSYANQRRQNVAPHRVTTRLGYNYRRFNGSFGLIWADDKPEGSGTGNYGRYFGALTKIDCSLNLRLTKYATLYVQGRNIANAPDLSYFSPPGVQEGQQGVLRRHEQYGANWVFGLKGQF